MPGLRTGLSFTQLMIKGVRWGLLALKGGVTDTIFKHRDKATSQQQP